MQSTTTATIILLSAGIGSLTTLVGVFLSDFLSSRRELKRLRLEGLVRFSAAFNQDPIFQKARGKLEKGEVLDEGEIEDYIGFFEEVGLFTDRGYVDEELIDEIFGDYIIDAYQDKRIMQHVAGVRTESRDKTYFIYFERLGEKLAKKAQKRKGG